MVESRLYEYRNCPAVQFCTGCKAPIPLRIAAVTNWDELSSTHKAANAARRLAHAIKLVRYGMDPAEVAKTTGVDLHELLPHALPPGAWDAQQAKDQS